MPNELFDLSFLQNFSFSPTLTLNKPATSLTKITIPSTAPPNTNQNTTFPDLEEELLPTDHLLHILFGKEDNSPYSCPKSIQSTLHSNTLKIIRKPRLEHLDYAPQIVLAEPNCNGKWPMAERSTWVGHLKKQKPMNESPTILDPSLKNSAAAVGDSQPHRTPWSRWYGKLAGSGGCEHSKVPVVSFLRLLPICFFISKTIVNTMLMYFVLNLISATIFMLTHVVEKVV